MGITVYLNINVLDGYDNIGNTITNVHGIPVMTFATKSFTWNQLFLKRVIDIVGGFVGLIITAVVTPFVAVPLLIESPGPLFFRQKRVGRNGRYFKIIKFRSMYMDAEERKKELMAQNEMSGLMFKMTNDPRVTMVGKFIRATSIDELPQFWNVLMGDMSLVGTRPPTVDEFKEYSPYHKRRLSLKPGLTGMWQVSGRSNIENFEEVVRLDLEYIDNWSIALDIKILLKTIVVVFAKVGSK
jgi:exopolysaccharide biosynthesis polyprenyl glycosylphosphotransferase